MEEGSVNFKTIAAAVAALAGVTGGAGYLGWSVEPAALGECRIDRVQLETNLAHQTEKADECRAILERITGDTP